MAGLHCAGEHGMVENGEQATVIQAGKDQLVDVHALGHSHAPAAVSMACKPVSSVGWICGANFGE